MPRATVEKYSLGNPIMTGDALLELAQSHRLQSIKRLFSYDIGTHDQIKVSEEDIENMGEALKCVFYIPIVAFREAVALAHEHGVLIGTSSWLKDRQ